MWRLSTRLCYQMCYILYVKEILEQYICSYHCPEGSPTYVEAVNSSMLPNVLYIIGKGDLRAVYMFLSLS